MGFSSCGLWTLQHRFNSCGTWAQLPHSMWGLPGLWMEPVSSILAGGFFTSEPPEKPLFFFLMKLSYFLTLKQVFSSNFFLKVSIYIFKKCMSFNSIHFYKCTQVSSTQIKKQNITTTPEGSSCFLLATPPTKDNLSLYC